MFTKKKTPTLTTRTDAAKALASSAISSFHAAADDLEQAAEDLAEVQAYALDEVDRLTAQADEAAEAEQGYRHAARKIRDLVG